MPQRSMAALALLIVEYTLAYSDSEADCKMFAALWSGTCGGTDDDVVYSTTNWHTSGAGGITRNCFTGDDDTKVLAPETGA
mmetsp:Transcript_841/g.1132  ORF Transcript_841/g.1132 Transcript_841/m.1132 type:complete len:81 (+) Transcript_841:21-263(+)